MKSLLQNLAAVSRFPRKDLMRIAIPVALLALVASVVTGMEKPSAAAIESSAARVDTRVRPQEADLDLSGLREDTEDSTGAPRLPVRDPFAQRSFSASAAPNAGVPAAPAVPALPYRYIGKAIEDGKLSVFLQRGDQSYSVTSGQKRGSKLDDDYRVLSVTGNAVTFLYIPLKKQQTLEIPAVN
jgi:hypothetical protein